MIKLIDPSYKYIKQYKEAYVLTMEGINKGIISKHDIMFENPDEIDVVKSALDQRDKSKLPSHYVPSYNYFLVDGEKLLGVIHIRVELTEMLFRFGGHIGYGINPKYFRQGYGTLLLKMGLEKAKDFIRDDKVLITCDDDNYGSQKVIEHNHGKLENKVINNINGEEIVTRRYWISLY